MLRTITRVLRSHLPAGCIVCGRAALADYSICSNCERELPRLTDCCDRCGIELRGLGTGAGENDGDDAGAITCNSCLITPPSFHSCRAVFPYTSPINKLIANFKFCARFDIGYALSRILASEFNAYYGSSRPNLVLPVPLHRHRHRERGFNQALEICRVISAHCDVPISHSLLLKTRSTEAQTSMRSAVARKANLRGAFALQLSKNAQDVTHIALVDDVVTTMATVDTISRVLRSQWGCRIDVWCLARASR